MKIPTGLLPATAVLILTLSPAHAQVSPGDVFVSVPNSVLQYSPNGNLKRTMKAPPSRELDGSAFDRQGYFYVAAGFASGNVLRFTPQLVFDRPFGEDYENEPESILFDSSGNCYVGAAQTGGSVAVIKKFSGQGKLLETLHVKRERRGADWIDLAKDQRTMFYTSEGSTVFRYDVQSHTQLPDFSHPGSVMYALRILPDGGVLVANTNNVLRLDSSGNVVKRYFGTFPNNLFALNLDPDGKSFWTAEVRSGQVYRVDIDSGSVLATISTGMAIGGLSIYGERTASVSTTPPPPPPPAAQTPPPPPPPPPPPAGQITFGLPTPCIIGTVPTRSVGQSTVDLSTAKITGNVTAEVTSRFHGRGATLEIDTGSGWQQVTGNPIRVSMDQGSPRKWPVRLRVSDCPSPIASSDPPEIEVRATGADGRPQELRVPVVADVKPGPFLHCWWPVLAGIGALLLGFIIFYGFWSPARFESRVGVMLSLTEDLDADGFFFPIRAARGSRAGFYRDASVYVSQDFRVSRRSRNALVHLRADKKRIKMKPMVTLWRNTGGDWEEVPRTESYVRPGVLHRNDSKTIFFEIRNR